MVTRNIKILKDYFILYINDSSILLFEFLSNQTHNKQN